MNLCTPSHFTSVKQCCYRNIWEDTHIEMFYPSNACIFVILDAQILRKASPCWQDLTVRCGMRQENSAQKCLRGKTALQLWQNNYKYSGNRLLLSWKVWNFWQWNKAWRTSKKSVDLDTQSVQGILLKVPNQASSTLPQMREISQSWK